METKIHGSQIAPLRFCLRDIQFHSTCCINGHQVLTKSEHRDLGIMASSDLSWDTHYDNLASRATMSLLCQLFKSVVSTL